MSQRITLSDGNIFIRPFRAEDIAAVFEAVSESIKEVSPLFDFLVYAQPHEFFNI